MKKLFLKMFCVEISSCIVVKEKLVKIGGEGGLIAVDKVGNISLCFNSDGMYRASVGAQQDLLVAIYGD